ncbi:MAG: YjbH domain-containing protein, partial [Chlamydiia bacterium]|nr:YjbH domain-containing protein [Chlamydiia bacterium]
MVRFALLLYISTLFGQDPNIPIMFQNLGISQSQRSRFSLLEAASYPGDKSDAERIKDRNAGEGKNQVLEDDRYNLSKLFEDLKIVEEVNAEISDTLPYHYNDALMGGYFRMPSARMAPVGRVALGYSYLPPYRNYAATLQALERLEFGINYTTYIGIPDPVMGSMGFGDYTDRGANLKLGVLRREDGFPYFPEIAVGFEDFYGTKRFHAFYVVATKSFLNLNGEITLGWGKGRIKGFFGGVGWTPFRKSSTPGLNRLTLLGEWDAIDYHHHSWEHPKARHVKSRVNLGLSTTLFDCLQLSVSSIRGEKFAASASLSYNLGDSKGFFPKVDDPPYYKAPIDTEPLGWLRAEKELSHELALALSEQGLSLFRIYLTAERALWMKIINLHYLQEKEVKKRISNVLANLLPSNIPLAIVVVEADGIPSHEYRFRGVDLARYREGEMGSFEWETLTLMKDPTQAPSIYGGTLLYHRMQATWTFTVRPRLLTFFGSASGKFKYSAGIVAGPEGFLFDTVYYKAQGAYNIKSSFSDISDMDRLNPSQILNVRSDSVKYFQTNTASLEQAFLQKGFILGKGWYGRCALGYFEPAYGGVATEFLYYPVGSH